MSVQAIDKSVVADLLRQKRYSEAAETADLYLREHPDDPAMTHAYGTALYRMGNYTGALIAYRRRLELEPRRAVAHYSFGLARVKTDDRDGARRSFERAIALDPTMASAAKQLKALALAPVQPPEPSPDPTRQLPHAISAPAPAGTSPSRALPAGKPPTSRRSASSEAQDRAKKGELGQGQILFNGNRNIRSRPGHFIVSFGFLVFASQLGPVSDSLKVRLGRLDGIDQNALETTVSEVAPLVALLLVVLAITVLTRAVLASLMTRYQINTESITVVQGILWRRMDFYYTYEVNSVEYTQGPIEALLNNATLHLTTERTEEKTTGLNARSAVPKVLELKGIGTSADARSLFYGIRSAALGQDVGLRGNLLR